MRGVACRELYPFVFAISPIVVGEFLTLTATALVGTARLCWCAVEIVEGIVVYEASSRAIVAISIVMG